MRVGASGFEPLTSCTPSKRAIQAAPRPAIASHRDRKRLQSAGVIRLDFAKFQRLANASSYPMAGGTV